MTDCVLTAAQERVARELALGYDPPEIADRLNLSIHTVRSHVRHVAALLPGTEPPVRKVRRWAMRRRDG